MRLIGVWTLTLLLFCSPIRAELVGHWPFEEGTGDTTADLSPSGTTGMITNAATGGMGVDGSVWVTDPDRGSVLSFNGAADGAFVIAGTIPQMTLANDFTWAFWANQDSANTQPNNIILGNRRNEAGADFDPRQFIKFTPTKFEWHMNGNGDDNLDYADLSEIADIWHHHAVVKTGDTLTYYRDGVQATQGVFTQPLDFAQPLHFAGEGSDGENWQGMLDDVRIYDNALSAAEILALAPDAPDPPPPALPPFTLGTGNWNVRILGVDTKTDGTGDGDVNDATEMRAILNYVGPFNGDWISGGSPAGDPGAGGGPTTDEAMNTNGWAIYEDHQESRNVVDMATGGAFDSNHPYPGPDPPNLTSEDFIISANTEDPLNFAPGTYAIAFGSDDGGFLSVKPTDGSSFSFDAEVNTNGDDVIDDTLLYNATRGHAQTCGEFTVGAGGLSAHIEAAMFERSGGDSFEVSISAGECRPFGNGYFQLLADESLANDAETGFLVTTGTPVPNSTTGGLMCDFDADGNCDQDDINTLYESNPTSAQIDTWLSQASDEANTALGSGSDVLVVGDADLSGEVTSADLGLLLNNFGSDTSTWLGGDLNASGGVDSADLGLLLNNFGFTSSAAAAVPEPNALALVGLGVLGMLAIRRRR